MVKLMNKIILDHSLAQTLPFEVKLLKDNSISKEAQQYSKNDFVFMNDSLCLFKWDSVTNTSKYQISFNPRFCSCIWFLDLANCRHYVAACILSNKVLDDDEKNVVMVRGRERPRLMAPQRRY